VFHPDRCDLCGDCLARCPELALGRDEARREMERLVRGGEPSPVLTRCSSCLSCNSYCTRGAEPYSLILARWNDRYARRGAPAVWKFVFPTERENLWSCMHALLPPAARRTLEEWMTRRPAAGTVFLPGSFYHLVPEVLAGSRLLDGLTPLSLPGHWEAGAYLYQGGYLDVVKRIGRMVRDDLDRWGVRRVVTGLDAVHTLFTRIHPEENGIRFQQSFTTFHAWILEGIRSGRLRLARPLGRTVTVHDNCYAKAAGAAGFAEARELLGLAGVTVREMRHHHQDALCCGFGRGAGWSRNHRIPADILQGTLKRIREAEATGADTLVTYCAGCFWLFLAAAALAGTPVRVVHLVELLRESMGETVAFDRQERAWDILAAMTWKTARETGRRNVWIRDVRAELDPSVWNADPQRGLRALRRALGVPRVRAAVRAGFRVLGRMTR